MSRASARRRVLAGRRAIGSADMQIAPADVPAGKIEGVEMGGLFTWFKGLDLLGKAGVGLVLAGLVFIAVMTAREFVDAAFEAAEEKGGATVRADSAEKGLADVVEANEAAETVKRDAVVRDALCVRTSRTPENC
jgi:hypothetical protein